MTYKNNIKWGGEGRAGALNGRGICHNAEYQMQDIKHTQQLLKANL